MLISALTKEKVKVVLSIICVVTLLLVMIAGFLNYPNIYAYSFDNVLSKPSLNNLFGTDNYGRDVFLLTCCGMLISIIAGFISSIISVVVAIFFSLLSVSSSSLLNKISEIITNAILGIPHLILMILISFAVGKGAIGVILATSLTHWPTLSKVLTNELKQIYNSDWYQVEKKLANSAPSFFIRHVAPSIKGTIITGLILAFPHSILHESTLTFLGLGFSAETPAIGNLLNSSLGYLLAGQWWISIFEGLTLVAVVLLLTYLVNRVNFRMSNKASL